MQRSQEVVVEGPSEKGMLSRTGGGGGFAALRQSSTHVQAAAAAGAAAWLSTHRQVCWLIDVILPILAPVSPRPCTEAHRGDAEACRAHGGKTITILLFFFLWDELQQQNAQLWLLQHGVRWRVASCGGGGSAAAQLTALADLSAILSANSNHWSRTAPHCQPLPAGGAGWGGLSPPAGACREHRSCWGAQPVRDEHRSAEAGRSRWRRNDWFGKRWQWLHVPLHMAYRPRGSFALPPAVLPRMYRPYLHCTDDCGNKGMKWASKRRVFRARRDRTEPAAGWPRGYNTLQAVYNQRGGGAGARGWRRREKERKGGQH